MFKITQALPLIAPLALCVSLMSDLSSSKGEDREHPAAAAAGPEAAASYPHRQEHHDTISRDHPDKKPVQVRANVNCHPHPGVWRNHEQDEGGNPAAPSDGSWTLVYLGLPTSQCDLMTPPDPNPGVQYWAAYRWRVDGGAWTTGFNAFSQGTLIGPSPLTAFLEAQTAYADANLVVVSPWSNIKSVNNYPQSAPGNANWNITQPATGTFNVNTLGDPAISNVDGVKVSVSNEGGPWNLASDMGLASNQTVAIGSSHVDVRIAWAFGGVQQSPWSAIQSMDAQ